MKKPLQFFGGATTGPIVDGPAAQRSYVNGTHEQEAETAKWPRREWSSWRA